MVQRMIGDPPILRDVDHAVAASMSYDIAVWTAGFEARSRWLVTSPLRPQEVKRWFRVEYTKDREVFSAPRNIQIGLGALLGDAPGEPGWDGYWTMVWRNMLNEQWRYFGRKLSIFVDYSSMSRAVYGTLLLECLRSCSHCVRSLTLAYVPGIHAYDINGSRSVEGLRALIGTEGRSVYAGVPAFILGLGYDGLLADAVVDIFQVSSFSCYYGDPGVYGDSVARVIEANRDLLSRSELTGVCPAWSIGDSLSTIQQLCEWYSDRRDIILVPLGPKPHVVGAILAASMDRDISFRSPKLARYRPVEVTVAEGVAPYVTRIEFSPG